MGEIVDIGFGFRVARFDLVGQHKQLFYSAHECLTLLLLWPRCGRCRAKAQARLRLVLITVAVIAEIKPVRHLLDSAQRIVIGQRAASGDALLRGTQFALTD